MSRPDDVEQYGDWENVKTDKDNTPIHVKNTDAVVLREMDGVLSPDAGAPLALPPASNQPDRAGLAVAPLQVRPDYPPSVADELFKILERELDVVATIKTGKVVRRL